jgi:hypothetical protein
VSEARASARAILATKPSLTVGLLILNIHRLKLLHENAQPGGNPAFEAALADELVIALILTCGNDLRTFILRFFAALRFVR